jgi:hypothetical protein
LPRRNSFLCIEICHIIFTNFVNVLVPFFALSHIFHLVMNLFIILHMKHMVFKFAQHLGFIKKLLTKISVSCSYYLCWPLYGHLGLQCEKFMCVFQKAFITLYLTFHFYNNHSQLLWATQPVSIDCKELSVLSYHCLPFITNLATLCCLLSR